MCASKIQSVFRGYLTRKYHQKAVKKLNNFKTKMRGLIAGWKVRKIMQCVKVD